MLKQTFSQKLQVKLSPQQIQIMKLLQIPTLELDQRVKDEIELNPALEEGEETGEEEEENMEEQEQLEQEEKEKEENDEVDLSDYFDEDDIPDYKLHVNNHSADDENRETPIGSGRTFQDLLYAQLTMSDMDEHEMVLAEYLIGNLDESGYLRRELAAVVNDLAFSMNIQTNSEELERVLLKIQELDPPGVGARDLRECLLIQINRTAERDVDLVMAKEIISKYFDEFTRKHYERIARKLEIPEEDMKSAIDFILHLNPKPGDSMVEASRTIQHITPDFVVSVENDELKLTLHGRNTPELRISREYKNMMEHYAKSSLKDKKEMDAMMFVKQKIDAAHGFIDAVKQRNETLFLTMQSIMEYQREFFLTGDETKLKPMILKDIADRMRMDISTVSRVANSKYVQTPYTTYLLKYFFSESITTDEGDEVSSREVKQILRNAVEEEPKRKPLTDQRLMKILNAKGYKIARRTIAKYREQLNIPVARLRKEL